METDAPACGTVALSLEVSASHHAPSPHVLFFFLIIFSGFFFLNLLLWFSSLQTVYPIPNKYNSFYLFSKFHFISNLTKLILIQQQQHLINSSNFYHKSSTKLKNPNRS